MSGCEKNASVTQQNRFVVRCPFMEHFKDSSVASCIAIDSLLRGEAVAQARIPHVLVYVITTKTHTNLQLFHYLGFGRIDPLPLYA